MTTAIQRRRSIGQTPLPHGAAQRQRMPEGRTVVRETMARLSCSRVRPRVLVSLAPLRSVPEKIAFRKLQSVRSAPVKLVEVRFAPEKSHCRSEAFSNTERMSVARGNCAPSQLARRKRQFWKVAPEQLAC